MKGYSATMKARATWEGFQRIDFIYEGREAVLVLPKQEDPKGKWMLKTEYFGAFPRLEIELLERGYYLAYLKNKSRWVKEDDIEAKASFIKHVSEKYSLSKKCIPIGMSCGGMHAIYLASRHPELIAAVYADAPVVNLLSCPFAIGRPGCDGMAAEFTDHKGLTLRDMLSFRDHPLDEAPAMASAGVPLVLVSGDSDKTVPYEENGAVLERIYKEAGAPLLTIIKKGGDHHPHGLEDNTRIIEFIERYYNQDQS